ncbi:GAF domain-containing protein [Aureimonas ureilytica]|uniref:GAF domain-containing protein n=1 Tax=Aureimonas ureilytica TaxID=401562 RepID=UPI000364FFF0|nr:GAF domain-containing protein [Aureimonas ureilytica]
MNDFVDLTRSLGEPRQPGPFFAQLDAVLKKRVGYILLTLLVVDGAEVVRLYTSDPASYPVSGRKPMTDTPWGDHVIKQGRSFLARDREGLRWAFYDHATIEALGGGSQINVPIVYDGRCIGTVNLTHREHVYGPEHLAAVEELAPLLIPAFLQAAALR